MKHDRPRRVEGHWCPPRGPVVSVPAMRCAKGLGPCRGGRETLTVWESMEDTSDPWPCWVLGLGGRNGRLAPVKPAR
jgi:hypothetical protein